MNLLIVIDVQKINYNEEVKDYVEKINDLVNSKKFDDVIFTRFINSTDNPVYTKAKWEDCIEEKDYALAIDPHNYKVFDKGTYNSLTTEVKEYIDKNNFDKIYLCGVDSDCCVLSTALNMFDNNYNVYVLKDYTFSMLNEENNKLALEIIERCIGSDYVI